MSEAVLIYVPPHRLQLFHGHPRDLAGNSRLPARGGSLSAPDWVSDSAQAADGPVKHHRHRRTDDGWDAGSDAPRKERSTATHLPPPTTPCLHVVRMKPRSGTGCSSSRRPPSAPEWVRPASARRPAAAAGAGRTRHARARGTAARAPATCTPARLGQFDRRLLFCPPGSMERRGPGLRTVLRALWRVPSTCCRARRADTANLYAHILYDK
ncbi:hypothetical protein HRG_014111 [Hirsutella rhossiliensis]